MSSIEAPVVPTNEASSAPMPRNAAFVRGVASQVALEHDAARDDEEPAQQHDERHVVGGGVPERRGAFAQVEREHRRSQEGAHPQLAEVGLPEVRRRKRQDGDGEQQARERQAPGGSGNEGVGVHEVRKSTAPRAPAASPLEWRFRRGQMAHYDVVVLGCGPGGERAAIQAARAGKTVAVVERAHVVGGNRVNWGTIPSKTLRESAVFFYQLTRNRLHGIRYEVGPELTVADFMHRERAVVQRELELINESLGRYAVEVVRRPRPLRGPSRGGGEAAGRRGHAHPDRRGLRDRHRLAPEPPRRRARSTARPSSTRRRSSSSRACRRR